MAENNEVKEHVESLDSINRNAHPRKQKSSDESGSSEEDEITTNSSSASSCTTEMDDNKTKDKKNYKDNNNNKKANVENNSEEKNVSESKNSNQDKNNNRKRKLSNDEEDQNASTSDSKRRKTDEGYREGGVQNQEDTKEYRERLEYLSKYGKNFYCPTVTPRKGLRPIYIDGSNIAYCHGKDLKFSVRGLKICIDYFKERGHKVVAFVPQFRLRKGETDDHRLIHELVKQKSVITTPTLYIKSQRRSPYDDWYIVQSAAVNDGIIVSRDNFQDIIDWKKSLRKTVEERRLVPTFVDDLLIFPVDPHGNRKNDFESFLKY